MEEVHKARFGEASMLSLDAPPSQHLHVFTNQKFSEPYSLGFLWKLQYISMID